ncbi:Isochorismatase [hydrothermal vent metagenome]|uniref:Isochorismatase n=1 Tax=hydrothermal vent metagenome TaxID=652676 RepID=A0A3B1D7X2_9ZZZZ
MNPKETALVLIGFQNDYFSPDGILYSVIEESSRNTGILSNTLNLIKQLVSTDILIVSTPIIFTVDYSELIEPVGILQTIKEVGAFKEGVKGSETILEISNFGNRIIEVPGKRGLNAFSNTDLDKVFKDRNIKNVVLVGTVTAICIDSTGRSAHERGYKVVMLRDCTSSRTVLEQDFYCEQIFPIYAEVMDHEHFLMSFPPEADPPLAEGEIYQ